MMRLLERLLRVEPSDEQAIIESRPQTERVARINVLQTRVDSLEARVENLETEERRTDEIRPR